MNGNNKIYADFELEGSDMFVVTPEGNYYHFPSPEYTEEHESIVIYDTKSHIPYTVIFNE